MAQIQANWMMLLFTWW